MTPEATPETVGRRLASARLRRGLAQKDVAERAGLAPSYLSRIETSKIQPTYRTLMQVVEALGVDPAEILGPRDSTGDPQGPCPVSTRGRCLLDLIRSSPGPEQYSPREIRLLRRFASWVQGAEPARLKAMEVLLEDLASARSDSGRVSESS